jgi:NADPH:quinone reductase-like Zn-dependent oxidoreductase
MALRGVHLHAPAVMPNESRAAVFDCYGPPGVIRFATIGVLSPAPNEVVIAVDHAAVNPIDCKTRAGFGVPVDLFPGRLGWDLAGRVVELGADVTHLRVGDAVFGMPRFYQHVGCYAEYVTVPADGLARIPAGLDARVAGAAPMVTLTAWQALFPFAGPLVRQRVLVHGASGGVGHIVVQLATHAGADVIATASARNRDFLVELGAREVVDYAEHPLEKVARDVDIAVDTRGGDDYVRLVETVRPGGLIVSLLGREAAANEQTARARGLRAGFLTVRPDGDVLARIGELLANGSLRVEIAEELPLAEAAKAHALVEGRHVRGKVLLTVGAEATR